MSVFNPEDKITWNELAPSLQQKIITLIKDTVSDDLKDRNSKIYKALIETLVASIYTNPNTDLRNAIRKAIKQDLLDRNTIVYTALIDTLVASIYTNPNSDLRNAIRNAIKQDLLDRNTIVYTALIETLVSSIYDNPNADLRNAIRKAIKQDLLDRNTIVYTALIDTLVASIYTNPNSDLRNAIRNAIKQDLLDRNTIVYTALIETLVASLNLSTPNNALITAVRNLLIADLGNKSSDVYNALINTLVSTINDTGSNTFKTTLLNYISKCIKDSINDPNSELYKNLKDFISKAIKDAVADTSSELYKNLRELISKTVKEAINDSNSDLHKNLKDFITKAIDEAINDTSSALYEKLKKLISTTIKQATSDSSSELYKNLRDFISKAVKDAVADTSSELYKNLRELISKTVKESISDSNSDLHKNLKDFITKAVDEAINDTSSALYERLKKLISTTIKQSTTDPSSELYKNLRDFISQTVEDAMKDTSSDLYENLRAFIAKTIKEAIDGTDKSSGLFEVIRTLTFNNLPPKVGFLDDTKVNLQGVYNMSYMGGMAGPYFISDAEGRECLFAVASGNSYADSDPKPSMINRPGVYRATRMTTVEDFVWENNAVRPEFIKNMSGYIQSSNGPTFDNIRATSIWGLSSDWIGLTVTWHNSTTAETTSAKYYLVFTNGSGSPQNWGNAKQGYVDMTPYTSGGNDISGLARIELTTGEVYYIIPKVTNVGVATIDPHNGESITDYQNTLYFGIYKATENRVTDHTVTLTKVREDNVGHSGWDFMTSGSIYDNSSSKSSYNTLGNPRLVYIKHMKCLLLVARSNCRGYFYNNSNQRVVNFHSGYVHYHHGLIDISNTDSALKSATSNFFGIKTNWTAFHLGYEYNMFRYNTPRSWQIPTPNMTYDELKRTVSAVLHEYNQWGGGYPSRSRLTIFGLNSDNAQSQFINYMKSTDIIPSSFPWSFGINQTTYPDFKKEVECMDKYILSDDTAPWSKTMKYLYIIHDIFVLYCGSKKHNGDQWTHITPTLLKNPVTNTPYNKNVFTCDVGQWQVTSGGYNSSSYSMVYTGGDYSELYYYDYNTREVKKNVTTTVTLENGSTVPTIRPTVDMELFTTFPDHDPRTILETYYASQISSHGVTILDYQRASSVYGNCSVLGGEFIAHVGCLRCKIHDSSPRAVSTVSGQNDDDLTLFYPTIVLFFKSGSYKVYNMYEMAINGEQTSLAAAIKAQILDNMKNKHNQNQTGSTGSSYYLPFFDPAGSFCHTYYAASANSDYSGPSNGLYDLKDNKMYLASELMTTWTGHVAGYSKSLGYYMTNCTFEYTCMYIACQKDYLGTEAPKTCTSIIDMFRNTGYYAKKMYTSASTGRVAYLSKTALYLGGYFSYLEPKELYLENGDNYIYITRDAASYELTVDIYDHQIGVPGESQFNRILISHIIVTNGMIATQADYDIAYYSMKSLV